MAAFHFHSVAGDGVHLITGFTQAGAAMEFPMMPRAYHVFAVQGALPQGAAGVITGAGDGAELAALPRHRQHQTV